MSGTGGWYPDPQDPSRARWWDGEWTDHVRDPEVPPAAVATLTRVPTPTAPDPPAPPAPDAGAPEPPADAAPATKPKPKPERSSVSPIKVAIVVLVVGLLVFGGLWAAGIVSPTDATTPAGTPTASEFAGPGYTFDVPADWSQQSGALATNVDVAFSAPPAATVTIGSVEGDAAELTDDAARQAAIDSMLRVQLSVYPDVAVVSREPASLDGAPGERITLEGPGPTGETVRVVELVAVRDGRIVFLGLEGAPDAVDAAAPAFDGAIGSFSFDA